MNQKSFDKYFHFAMSNAIVISFYFTKDILNHHHHYHRKYFVFHFGRNSKRNLNFNIYLRKVHAVPFEFLRSIQSVLLHCVLLIELHFHNTPVYVSFYSFICVCVCVLLMQLYYAHRQHYSIVHVSYGHMVWTTNDIQNLTIIRNEK